MPIGNMQWRVEIEMFNSKNKTRFINEKSLLVVGLSSAFCFSICFAFVILMLFACGDIELNLGPKKRSSGYNLSVCHWNFSSITALNFALTDIIQAYNSTWGKVFKNGPSKNFLKAVFHKFYLIHS